MANMIAIGMIVLALIILSIGLGVGGFMYNKKGYLPFLPWRITSEKVFAQYKIENTKEPGKYLTAVSDKIKGTDINKSVEWKNWEDSPSQKWVISNESIYAEGTGTGGHFTIIAGLNDNRPLTPFTCLTRFGNGMSIDKCDATNMDTLWDIPGNFTELDEFEAPIKSVGASLCISSVLDEMKNENEDEDKIGVEAGAIFSSSCSNPDTFKFTRLKDEAALLA